MRHGRRHRRGFQQRLVGGGIVGADLLDQLEIAEASSGRLATGFRAGPRFGASLERGRRFQAPALGGERFCCLGGLSNRSSLAAIAVALQGGGPSFRVRLPSACGSDRPAGARVPRASSLGFRTLVDALQRCRSGASRSSLGVEPTSSADPRRSETTGFLSFVAVPPGSGRPPRWARGPMRRQANTRLKAVGGPFQLQFFRQ